MPQTWQASTPLRALRHGGGLNLGKLRPRGPPPKVGCLPAASRAQGPMGPWGLGPRPQAKNKSKIPGRPRAGGRGPPRNFGFFGPGIQAHGAWDHAHGSHGVHGAMPMGVMGRVGPCPWVSWVHGACVKCTGGAPHSAAAQDRENRAPGPGAPQGPPEHPKGPPGPGETILDHFGDQKEIEKN